uniref:DNA cytosine methyltransferase n=1 Tax=Senegalimassilia anaerobia TaxID=1473216 RepID=UPI00248DF612
LFESEGMRGNYPSSREKRQSLAAAARQSLAGAECLNPEDPQSKRIFTMDSCGPTLSSGTNEGMNIQPLVLVKGCPNPIALADMHARAAIDANMVGTLHVGGDAPVAAITRTLAFNEANITSKQNAANPDWDDECHTLSTDSRNDVAIDAGDGQMVVRRLTPRECERLQGFPDDWTRIPYRGKPAEECPDGPRYKAIGNSMAVPVMRWIFERMEKER